MLVLLEEYWKGMCVQNPLCVSVVPYRVVIFPSRKLSGASTSSNAWVSLGGTHGQTSKIPVPRNQVELVFQVTLTSRQ